LQEEFSELIKIKYINWVKTNIASVKRGLFVAGMMAGIALFLSVAVTVVLLALEDRGRLELDVFAGELDYEDIQGGAIAIDVRPNEEIDEGGFLRAPARTNFIFIGLDQHVIADAIMVGTFYRDTGDIHIMSVPRDMFVRVPAHRQEQMRAQGLRPPSTLKVGELRSYGGQMHGIYFLIAQLEEMFGVDFDFYVEVELAAFRRIVDAIGGVYMDIPRRLFYLDPVATPPLRIDVPAGRPRLDGNMAEGVVRYRNFPMGDLDRNRMQMDFMRELINQATTRDALMNDPLALIGIVINDVRTNFSLTDAARYVPLLPRISGESFITFTLPFTALDPFVMPDTNLLPAIISEIFYATPEEEQEELHAELNHGY